MLYLIGIHRLPEMNNYFSNNWVLLVQNFALVFTKVRWWQSRSNIHLTNNEDPDQPRAGTPGLGKLWKITPLFDLLTKEFREKYHTGQNISMEETLAKGMGEKPAAETCRQGQHSMGTWLFLLCLCVRHAGLLQ